jgi:hypothetical protein
MSQDDRFSRIYAAKALAAMHFFGYRSGGVPVFRREAFARSARRGGFDRGLGAGK